MKLLPFELILLHPCSEDVGACITAQSEVVVVTVGTVGLVILARERTVDQRHFAVDTLETVLMPVLVLVRQVLEVGSDGLFAFLAPVGEQLLVALYAERLVVSQYVAVSGQI